MQSLSPCPDARDLQRLLLGLVPGPDAELLERHFSECGRCGSAAPDVPAEDALLDAVRTAAELPLDDTDRAVVTVLTRRFKTLPSARPAAPPAAADTTAAAEALGRLGGYRLCRVLGAGGMGVVFQAEDPQLRRFVALKVMKPALAASATARERFLREARLTAAVRHDHIVTIHHVGEADGVPFLAMEMLEGEALEHRLDRPGPLPIDEVLRIGREAAEGLAAAHARGLIHRDVKPANIWLEGDRGRVKILDFGLARAAEPDAVLTQSGAIVGTPAYMAPEQARGEAVDARCDLFSLGCVLYRMATGRAPFHGATVSALLLAAALEVPPAAHTLNPEVPPALSALIARLLAKDPAGRPASARAVLDALTDIRPAAPRPPSRRAAPRRRLLLAGALLLGLLAAALFALRDREAPRPDQPADVVPSAADDDSHPLFLLRPERIPPGIRFDGQPDELVGAMGQRGPAVRCLTFAPDGRRLLGSTSHRDAQGFEVSTLHVWDLATGQEMRHFEIPRRGIASLAFSPDGRRILATGEPRLAVLCDADSGEVVLSLKGAGDIIFSTAFAPDGATLITGDRDMHNGAGSVRWWDARTGEPKACLRGHTFYAVVVAFCPDGRHAVSGSHGRDQTVRLWDLEAGREVRRFDVVESGASSLAVSPDGKHLAVGRGDGRVLVGDFHDPRPRPWRELTGHTGAVALTSFSPGGTLTTVSDDYRILRHDLSTGAVVLNRKLAGTAGSAAVAPDGRHLAVANPNGTLFLFRLPP